MLHRCRCDAAVQVVFEARSIMMGGEVVGQRVKAEGCGVRRWVW
jgi:hypothetical protein